MSQVLVRDLDPAVVRRLKARAKRQGRSLQAVAKEILEEASLADADEARKVAERFAQRLANRQHSDSAVLLAADRRR
jgi:antitoxin FitA